MKDIRTITITANGNHTPDDGLDEKLEGTYQVQISGDLGSGALKPQGKNTSAESYVDFLDIATGNAFSFTTTGIFVLDINGFVNINMAGATDPDCKVIFSRLKNTVKSFRKL